MPTVPMPSALIPSSQAGMPKYLLPTMYETVKVRPLTMPQIAP